VLSAVLLAAILIGGAAYADRELGPAELGSSTAATAASGEWFCPHGGGESEWEVFLQVANPGDAPATIRVRTLGTKRPTPAETLSLEPRSFRRIPVPADGRGRASVVEWFDQWVAVGWIAHAGGGEGGVAAEPCAPAAGARWFLPDGTTEEEVNDDYVVVMNPFARTAVFSAVLYSERQEAVIAERLTDIALGPFRSRAIRLNSVVKGERTVATLLDVSVGRVAAATLGISTEGGIRSALGYLGAPPATLTFPGGADAGRTDLAVMNTSLNRVALAATVFDKETDIPFAGIADAPSPPESGRTHPTTTAGASAVTVRSEQGGVAAARRTFGTVSDQAATNGAVPAAAWLVLPGVAGEPSRPGLVLANPGDEPVEVTLTYLGSDSGVTVTVPARRTATAPGDFLQQDPEGAVLAVAVSGTFVPASASYSLGREGSATYAVALGIPVPQGWLPAST
jgi:hypothetical protein